MKRPLRYIRQHLSLRLGLIITLIIAGGFTQVLTASLPDLPAEEIADITGRISESATDIARLAKDLDRVASSNQEEFVNNVG